MEAVREPETIRLYREDEVVELVAKYLLANKQAEYYGMYLMAAPIVAGLIWDLLKGNWR